MGQDKECSEGSADCSGIKEMKDIEKIVEGVLKGMPVGIQRDIQKLYALLFKRKIGGPISDGDVAIRLALELLSKLASSEHSEHLREFIEMAEEQLDALLLEHIPFP